MSRIKNVSNGITKGLINNALTIILPFISRTIIIQQLGTEYVGLGGLFTSILQVLSLSELGFGTAIGYMLYKPIAEKDTDSINAILNFYKKVYRVIGIVILAVSVVLIPFLDNLIAGDIPNGINIYVLYFIYVFNTVISYFLFAYKKILLSAHQRYDTEVSIASFCILMQYTFQIILLVLFKNYYVYVLVIPVMTLINNIVSVIIVNKNYPEYYCKGELDSRDIKGILKNTGGAFFAKIGSTVFLSVDDIVISAVLGLTILGIYKNYYYVISCMIAIFAVVHNSIRPVIGNILVTETKELIWNTFRKINYIYMIFVIICASCCFSLLQDFEFVWCGSENMLKFDIVFLLVVCFFAGRLSSILNVYQEAAGILWQGKFIPLISAIVNLTINIILVNIIGLSGVVISSIVSALFVNFPGYTYIIFKHLFNEKKQKNFFLRDTAVLIIQQIIILSICTFTINRYCCNSWLELFVKAIITLCIVLVSIFLLNIKNPLFMEIKIDFINIISRKNIKESNYEK